jgi:hypothetical protein
VQGSSTSCTHQKSRRLLPPLLPTPRSSTSSSDPNVAFEKTKKLVQEHNLNLDSRAVTLGTSAMVESTPAWTSYLSMPPIVKQHLERLKRDNDSKSVYAPARFKSSSSSSSLSSASSSSSSSPSLPALKSHLPSPKARSSSTSSSSSAKSPSSSSSSLASVTNDAVASSHSVFDFSSVGSDDESDLEIYLSPPPRQSTKSTAKVTITVSQNELLPPVQIGSTALMKAHEDLSVHAAEPHVTLRKALGPSQYRIYTHNDSELSDSDFDRPLSHFAKQGPTTLFT